MKRRDTANLATGLDHVISAVTDVRGALETVRDLLGLPVAVPWAIFPSWQSGGLWAGNASIFFDSSPRNVFLAPTVPPRWRGLSLRPSFALDAAADSLRRQGFRVIGPKPYLEGGIELWRNVYVPDVLADDEMLFFTKYGTMRRGQFAAAQREFARSGGGPVGVVGVHSIGAGSDAQWPNVFASRTAAGHRLADGVQILPDGDGRGLTFITLEVRDASVAISHLSSRGVAVDKQGEVLAIDPSEVCGIDIRIRSR